MNISSSTSAHLRAWVMLVLITLLSSASLYAQEARGTITGKVRDASQGVVPGAGVKITNVAMGTSVSVKTNEAGLYYAPFLIPGTYQVLVETSGFKNYLREGLILRVNDTLEIDIQLEVGAVGETVTVTGEAPALETTSASMGQVVDSRRVAELPIGHGDPYALIGLAGGVAFSRDQRLDRPFEPTHIVGFTIDGTRANRSDLTIDGVASTATANGGEVISSFVPPQDLVQEFKVQTATFDAQFGNTEGGVTNLSIKSGTNQFHGTASYANFTPGTSANDYFANRKHDPLGDFYYHRFGGTISGPVTIPKLYKGQNKTFFIYGFESIPEARPRNNGTFQVPTAKMRAGDFSDFPAPFQLYNPFSGQTVGANVVRTPFQCDAAGNPLAPNPATKVQPTGIACNKIPAALFNATTLNFMNGYLPLPTSPATAADGTNNFQQPDLLETTRYYSHTVRLDHVISDKQRIFGRVSWYDRDSNYNNYFRNLVTGEYFNFFSRQAAIDDVYTLNATTVLNLRYGYNRFIRVTNSNPANRGFDIGSLGFDSRYTDLISDEVRRFPRFDINGYQGTGIGGEFRPNDTHNVIATVNRAQGVHSLKAGLEFRAYRETSNFFGNDQSGRFNFDNTYVKQASNTTLTPQLGYSFAAFLLGVPTSGQINQPANYAETSTTWGLFFHDDWRVNSKLTLNLGLRYEVEGALTERYNRSVSGFDFGAAQSIEGVARAAYDAQVRPTTPEIAQFNVRGGLLFPGINGASRGLYETPKKNFMPRIGFAYKLNDKTVVRGGYGIFYGFLGQRRGDVSQLGFSTNTPLNVTDTNGASFNETLANPFRTGLVTPQGAGDGLRTALGQSITFFNPNPLSPYNQRWQLGFQRELPSGFVAEVSYVGNRGTHVEITRNLNATPNQFLSSSPTRDTARNNYLAANVPNPFRGVGIMPNSSDPLFRANTIARERLLRPFPQFDAVNTTTNEGYSWYHSLQMSLEKRFAKGYTINASYTFAKFMEATDLLNAGDPAPTEMISASDIPHRLTVSGIYELPFGKGRRFLPGLSSWASHLVSGWQVSGIYAMQVGAPFGNWGNILYYGDIKDIELSGDQQTIEKWINTNGFVALRRRTATGGTEIVNGTNGQPILVNFNDPCKNTYDPASCPGTPLAGPVGFNRDSALSLTRNVRTFQNRFSSLRAPRTSNFDFGITKKTKIGEGSKEFQFRADLLNAFNHPLLLGTGGVNLDPTATAFGQITSGTQANYPRRVQMTLKFLF
ncbi:MAG TPA: TonB-dependent receptor [Blastocatellia bacterium]|nr:TonB-dependent receptor [Blastocatellia bacterium]